MSLPDLTFHNVNSSHSLKKKENDERSLFGSMKTPRMSYVNPVRKTVLQNKILYQMYARGTQGFQPPDSEGGTRLRGPCPVQQVLVESR